MLPTAILLVASALGSYIALRFLRFIPEPPPVNTRIRLRKGSGVFVCHVLGKDGRGWRITAPMIRSEIVPLREAEYFMADYATAAGVFKFTTRIIARESEGRSVLIIEPPKKLITSERRNGERTDFEPAVKTIVNDTAPAELRNLSIGGALLRTPMPVSPGQRVEVLSRPDAPRITGTVVACDATASELWPGFHVRLKLERSLTVDQIAGIK